MATWNVTIETTIEAEYIPDLHNKVRRFITNLGSTTADLIEVKVPTAACIVGAILESKATLTVVSTDGRATMFINQKEIEVVLGDNEGEAGV